MIQLARPIVTTIANIVFRSFVLLDLKSGDGQRAETVIPTGRNFGLVEWIKRSISERRKLYRIDWVQKLELVMA